VEVGLLETVEQSVLVAAEHQQKTDRGEESYDGLQRQKESSEVGSLDYVGVLVAQLELIKCENAV
jgi:hypothetical protein